MLAQKNLPAFTTVLLLSTILVSCAFRSAAVQEPESADQSSIVSPSSGSQTAIPVALISPSSKPTYLVRFGDELQVSFYYAEEFNQQVAVRPDGRITLPWVGDLEVVGRTTNAIADTIEAYYSQLVRDPKLIVSVQQVAPMRFYVFGEVNKPGYFEAPDRLSLLEAIAMAGGMTGEAEWKSVLLFHSTFGDSAEVEVANLEITLAQDNQYALHYVESFDVIYVPPTFISNVHKFIQDYVVKILPPVDSYMRNRYYWYYGMRQP